MRTRNVCRVCGHMIESVRLSISDAIDTCEACAREIPGNILRQANPQTAILDATVSALSVDKGNATPGRSVDKRPATCLKCGEVFMINECHTCLPWKVELFTALNRFDHDVLWVEEEKGINILASAVATLVRWHQDRDRLRETLAMLLSDSRAGSTSPWFSAAVRHALYETQ